MLESPTVPVGAVVRGASGAGPVELVRRIEWSDLAAGGVIEYQESVEEAVDLSAVGRFELPAPPQPTCWAGARFRLRWFVEDGDDRRAELNVYSARR